MSDKRVCGECKFYVKKKLYMRLRCYDGYCDFFSDEDNLEPTDSKDSWDDCWQPKEKA